MLTVGHLCRVKTDDGCIFIFEALQNIPVVRNEDVWGKNRLFEMPEDIQQ